MCSHQRTARLEQHNAQVFYGEVQEVLGDSAIPPTPSRRAAPPEKKVIRRSPSEVRGKASKISCIVF